MEREPNLEKMSPGQFLNELNSGRRNFDGLTIGGNLEMRDIIFDPPFYFQNITVEGDLTLENLRGCFPSKLKVEGALTIKNCN